jgi:hypothetical protein
MSALEQTIIEKVRKLDEFQQQSVLEFIEMLDPDDSDFDHKVWFKELQLLEASIRESHGGNNITDVQTILDELREERSTIRS